MPTKILNSLIGFTAFLVVLFLLLSKNKRIGELTQELEDINEAIDNANKANNARFKYNSDIDYADIVRKTFSRK